MAERLGFPRPDPTLIATAISEIARNIVVHAGRGEIVLAPFEDANRYGMVVIAIDEGPGIRDVEAALRDDSAAGAGSGSACRARGGSWTTSSCSPTRRPAQR